MKPAIDPRFAYSEGAPILPGLTITDIAFSTNVTPGDPTTGAIMEATFSGGPDLSGVVAGHLLTIDGTTEALNAGTFEIYSRDNTAKTVKYYNFGISDNSYDESGTFDADIDEQRSVINEFTPAKQILGIFNGERLAAGYLNNILMTQGAAVKWLLDHAQSLGAGRQIVAGDNNTLSDTVLVDTLTVTDIEWQGNESVDGVQTGLIRYTFSATPDLSAAAAGDYLKISTAGETENNADDLEIVTVHNTGTRYVDVYNPYRLDDTLDETGITAASVVIHDGTQTIDVSLTVSDVPAIVIDVTQSSHGFNVGECVYQSGGTWAKAQGNSRTTSTGVHYIIEKTTNTFRAAKVGKVTVTGHGLSGLYYLSASSAGALTTTKPVGSTTAPLGFYLPVLKTIDANTLEILGTPVPLFNPLLAEYIVGGSNATSVSFTNLDLNTVGSVVDIEISCESSTSAASNSLNMSVNNDTSGNDYAYCNKYDDYTAYARRTDGGSGTNDFEIAYQNATAAAQKIQSRVTVALERDNTNTTTVKMHSDWSSQGNAFYSGSSDGIYTGGSTNNVTRLDFFSTTGGAVRWGANTGQYIKIFQREG